MKVSIARDHSHACRRREKGEGGREGESGCPGNKKNMKAHTSSTLTNLKWAKDQTQPIQ